MKKQKQYSNQTDRERILEHLVCELASGNPIYAGGFRGRRLGLVARPVSFDHHEVDPYTVKANDLKPGDLITCRTVRSGVGVGYFVGRMGYAELYLQPIGYNVTVPVMNESFWLISYAYLVPNPDAKEGGGIKFGPPIPQSVFLTGHRKVFYDKVAKAMRKFSYIQYDTHRMVDTQFDEGDRQVHIRVRHKWKTFEESGYVIDMPITKTLTSPTICGLVDTLKSLGYGDDSLFAPQQS